MGSPRFEMTCFACAGGELLCAIPAAVSAGGEPTQLVLALHGYGSDERWAFGALPGWHGKRAVAAPRGPLPARDGGWAWCSAEFTEHGPVDDAGETLRSVELLRQAVPEIVRWARARADRVALFGHSQGGMIAQLLAGAMNPPPVAVAVVGAKLPPAPLDGGLRLAQVPVLACHGSRDRVVAADLHSRISAELEACGACVADHTYAGGHGLTRACAQFVADWLAGRIEEACSKEHA